LFLDIGEFSISFLSSFVLMSLFVGRISSQVRKEDLEELFSKYGHLKRCDSKGSFAFVTFEESKDAEEAIKECNGKDWNGSNMIVEWTKRNNNSSSSDRRESRCYVCQTRGHYARDCKKADGRSSYERRSDSRSGRDRRRSRSNERRRSRSNERRRRSHERSRSKSPKKSRSDKSPKPNR